MSFKRKHNHNATAEVECLENKTNNDSASVLIYSISFIFLLTPLSISFNNIAMLALNCSLLRFKPFRVRLLLGQAHAFKCLIIHYGNSIF